MGTYMECEYYTTDQHEVFNLELHMFGQKSYSIYGFLANKVNMSESPYISEPRGLPEFIERMINIRRGEHELTLGGFDWRGYESHYQNGECFGHSYVTMTELEAFDYSVEFVDQREDDKTPITMRDFLGEGYFADLKTLKENEIETIVFWFM